jgi:hypothetical protein
VRPWLGIASLDLQGSFVHIFDKEHCMAMYDPTMGTPQFQAHSAEPYDRGLRLSWSGVLGGTALGWAAFSMLMLVGAAIGLAKVDPTSAQPANGLGAASGIYGAIVLVATSFFGAFLAVRIAGNRRRPDALLHGGVCWAISMLVGAVLALGAARTATESAAAVASGPRAQARAQRESNVRSNNGGPTASDRQRAAEVTDTAAKTTGAGAGGAALALAASLLGALAAARRGVGKGHSAGLRRSDRREQTIHAPAGEREMSLRDEAIIVPPRS